MTWMLYILMTKPSLWEECVDEVDRVIGLTGCPTSETLASLPIIDATIYETLRFHSPVPLISRQVHTAFSIAPVDQQLHRKVVHYSDAASEDNNTAIIHLPVGSEVHIP